MTATVAQLMAQYGNDSSFWNDHDDDMADVGAAADDDGVVTSASPFVTATAPSVVPAPEIITIVSDNDDVDDGDIPSATTELLDGAISVDVFCGIVESERYSYLYQFAGIRGRKSYDFLDKDRKLVSHIRSQSRLTCLLPFSTTG
jgi:hypothetical protein